jgi:UDP-3-O-[3-hydroxymyristoyl] N-acetylglucosamine deacetylase
MIFQGTVKDSFEIKGIGLHSGRNTRVIVSPAPPDTGIVFVPGDASSPEQAVPAHYSRLLNTSNAITIGSGSFSIKTIEHVMAVLYVYDISNAYLSLEGEEMPILDGSSLEIVEAVEKVGVRMQNAFQKVAYIPYPIWIEEGGSYLIVLPNQRFKITYTIDFSSKSDAVGTQTAHYTIDRDVFRSAIAPARTFGFVEEIPDLQSKSLALGGSLDNALHFTRDGLVNDSLRFQNECVRHKILDLIGDLSLIGYRMCGHFIAYKSGHSLDLSFVRKIDRVVRRSGGKKYLPRDVVRRREVQFHRFMRKINSSDE